MKTRTVVRKEAAEANFMIEDVESLKRDRREYIEGLRVDVWRDLRFGGVKPFYLSLFAGPMALKTRKRL